MPPRRQAPEPSREDKEKRTRREMLAVFWLSHGMSRACVWELVKAKLPYHGEDPNLRTIEQTVNDASGGRFYDVKTKEFSTYYADNHIRTHINCDDEEEMHEFLAIPSQFHPHLNTEENYLFDRDLHRRMFPSDAKVKRGRQRQSCNQRARVSRTFHWTRDPDFNVPQRNAFDMNPMATSLSAVAAPTVAGVAPYVQPGYQYNVVPTSTGGYGESFMGAAASFPDPPIHSTQQNVDPSSYRIAGGTNPIRRQVKLNDHPIPDQRSLLALF